MGTFITVIHIIISISLILLVLIQRSKSEATAFLGGATSSNLFGGKGPLSFISKTTAVLIAIFFLTSSFLAIVQHESVGSIIQRTTFPEQAPVRQTRPQPFNALKPEQPGNVKTDAAKTDTQANSVTTPTTGKVESDKNTVPQTK